MVKWDGGSNTWEREADLLKLAEVHQQPELVRFLSLRPQLQGSISSFKGLRKRKEPTTPIEIREQAVKKRKNSQDSAEEANFQVSARLNTPYSPPHSPPYNPSSKVITFTIKTFLFLRDLYLTRRLRLIIYAAPR